LRHPTLQVTEVREDGTFIVLQDGSTWEVFLPDRPSTVEWKVGDYVMVRERWIAQGDYEYQLNNGRAHSVAVVRWAGMTR
jgi:hypothetical protein